MSALTTLLEALDEHDLEQLAKRLAPRLDRHASPHRESA